MLFLVVLRHRCDNICGGENEWKLLRVLYPSLFQVLELALSADNELFLNRNLRLDRFSLLSARLDTCLVTEYQHSLNLQNCLLCTPILLEEIQGQRAEQVNGLVLEPRRSKLQHSKTTLQCCADCPSPTGVLRKALERLLLVSPERFNRGSCCCDLKALRYMGMKATCLCIEDKNLGHKAEVILGRVCGMLELGWRALA